MEDITRYLEMILIFACGVLALCQWPLDPELASRGRSSRALSNAGFVAAIGVVTLEIYRYGFGGKVMVPAGSAISTAAYAGEPIMAVVYCALVVRRFSSICAAHNFTPPARPSRRPPDP
ncbi:hypothetical protein [Novosphingobium sp. AAP93]|uniref:hypothetical protein n=1 Tax=Novosphingobium sp. AAP93 TaxID=1523427 RepID=UPI0012E17402|nr:hypothetical protein [Novosphingobium sp. AAP93]